MYREMCNVHFMRLLCILTLVKGYQWVPIVATHYILFDSFWAYTKKNNRERHALKAIYPYQIESSFSTLTKMKTLLTQIIILICGFQIAVARQLPLKEISQPGCKVNHRSVHSNECKRAFSLPSADITKWNKMTTERLLFSVLYQGSYTNGYSWVWWHPWVDIVSAKGTPIYSIAKGTVTFAGNKNGYWNTIVIQHNDEGTILFSNYAHLDKILVSDGDIINEWQKVWEIGNTWFTMWPLGNHLDFQITTAKSPTHPYAYYGCDIWYRDAVQYWHCSDLLGQYTLDPIEFLHNKINQPSTWVVQKKPITQDTTQPNIQSPINAYQQILNRNTSISHHKTNTAKSWNLDTNPTIDFNDLYINQTNPIPTTPTTQDSKETSPNPYTSTPSVSTQHTLNRYTWTPKLPQLKNKSPYTLDIDLSSEHIPQGRFGKLVLDIYKDKKLIEWFLDHPVTITETNWLLQMYQTDINFLIDGSKTILFRAQEKGQTEIEIMIDGEVVDTVEITII